MLLKKRSVKPIVLAGVAALAYYAYTRMSEEQKKNLVDSVKKRGKDLLDRIRSGKPTSPGDNPQTGEI